MPDQIHVIDPNPYAASAVAEPRTSDVTVAGEVWRDGYYVVMHCDAVLPPMCFKSGEPAEVYFDCWPNPILSMLRQLPLGPKVSIPMSRRYMRQVFWTSSLLLIGGAVALILGIGGYIATLDDRRLSGIGPFFALYVSMSLLICGFAIRRIVPAQRRGNFVWLAGANPKLLDRLPTWKDRK